MTTQKPPFVQHTESPLPQAPGRMDDLAVLPVFWKLEGRRVLLAGGNEGAAWKAELLVASGAYVDIIAPALCLEMKALLASDRNRGVLVHHERPWSLHDFTSASLALAETESDAEAQAFYCAAKAAKVPVNVIDNPRFCDFQFGAIVNRSPVVVGISTDGAAPILGQAIRRKIETLLPQSIANAGRLAKQFRNHLKQLIPDASTRRSFWEKFVERAFKSQEISEKTLVALAEKTQAGREQSGVGFVSLVGSGPGDTDLMTMRAVRVLQGADVIMYDDLASAELLELGRREAKRLYVGKRGGRRSCSQAEINKMMINLALAGERVARLKGGDPMIFGRAGEEIADLLTHQIPFEVVPGITAASAAAAAMGVSLTHRDHAQSVRFVTGHAKSGQLPENLHWQGMASGDTSLVFYMASRTGNEVADNLIKHGMDASTPVVVVANASHPEQRIWKGDLTSLVEGIEHVAKGDPIVICIGTVFSLYDSKKMSALMSDFQNLS